MTYNLLFEFKEPGRVPEERAQDEPIVLGNGEAVVIPSVGDHVTYLYDGLPTEFKVVSRRFAYGGGNCTVNIGVAEPVHFRKALSLKE